MRNSPSNSTGGARKSFKKDDGKGPYKKESKPFKKKNYDGRPPADGDDRPARKSKPYSGRTTDKPSTFGAAGRKPKTSFGKREETETGEGRKPRKSFGKPGPGGEGRPFSDRPKRNFDKPGFKREDGDDRPAFKPRREFDKPTRGEGESKPFSERPKRTFNKPDFKRDGDSERPERKPRREFENKGNSEGESRPFKERPKRSFDKPAFDKPAFDKPAFDKKEGADGTERKPRSEGSAPNKRLDSRPFRERPKSNTDRPPFDRTKKDTDKKKTESQENLESPKPSFDNVINNAFNNPKKVLGDDHPGKRQVFEDKVYGELEEPISEAPKKPYEKKAKDGPGKKKFIHDHSEGRKKKYKDEDDEDDDLDEKEISQKNGPGMEMPLNKFIAHCGECSRRDAAELVKQGKVKVNGELVTDPGHKVKQEDKITLSGKKLTIQKGMVYILLNKPKGYITTNEDPQGRKTVMELVGNAGVDRLFPVGRLDRDTSGLLLITNDGDLTQKLCHPGYNIKKVYQVTLDKPLTHADFEKIVEGVELEDGKAIVDAIAYLEKKNELGLEIHSGRNRIVRRIFESLGYEVTKLDRVMYAGLTKKNLPRSKWRYLDEREVVLLKHFKS